MPALRKYFDTAMSVASCDHSLGISAPRSSNTIEPSGLVITLSRCSYSHASRGFTPGREKCGLNSRPGVLSVDFAFVDDTARTWAEAVAVVLVSTLTQVTSHWVRLVVRSCPLERLVSCRQRHGVGSTQLVPNNSPTSPQLSHALVTVYPQDVGIHGLAGYQHFWNRQKIRRLSRSVVNKKGGPRGGQNHGSRSKSTRLVVTTK